MTFEKIFEKIERVDNYGGFLLIRRLKPNITIQTLSDKDIISDIIASKFHHWRGEEEPNGLTVGMSSTDKFCKSKTWTLTEHKFYGFFDNSKIKTDYYKQITFDEFLIQITTAIKSETDNDNDFLQLSVKALSDNLNQTFTFYQLDLDKERDKDLVAEWQVYDFFYAYIAVDRQDSSVYLIEFGLD
jgi:hypothetical protein